MTITIDGPAAAGKTTLAKALADRYGFIRLDSGALYRALALHFKENPEDNDIPSLDFNTEGHVLIYGVDRERDIRTPAVAMAASELSKQSGVRTMVNLMLRRAACLHPNVVAEGRDMGTTVFPEAELKVYLTADISERAARRHRQNPETSYDDIVSSIEKRDHNDSSRTISPLKAPKDALIIDNTFLGVEDTISLIIEKVKSSPFPIQ